MAHNCQRCGNTFTGNGQRKYCSVKCANRSKSDKLIESWLAGENCGSGMDGELKQGIKSWLRSNAGNKCTQCGWSEINPYSGKVTLTVDHIDGKSNNNSPENLRVLCYNCHTLTPTFNQLNRGNGTRFSVGARI